MWKYKVKLYYSGLIASAYYCGAYLYGRAEEDLKRVDEEKKIYGLTEGDLLECWIDAHRDVKLHWDLIMKMAKELLEKRLLGAEYFEEILLTRI